VVRPLTESGGWKFAVAPGKLEAKVSLMLQSAPTVYEPPPRARFTLPLEMVVWVKVKLPLPSVAMVPI
jgi:hypothetical protein